MGANKWKSDLNKYFAGADVILVPDNDDAGYKHVQQVGAALSGIAKRIRVLRLPDLPDKGDASDWLAAGGTREEFDCLVEQAPDWQPVLTEASADDSDAKANAAAEEQKLIDELASLNRREYERRRNAAADDLGMRRGALDREVEARRAEQREQSGPVPLFGHWVVEPWPDEVSLAELLNDIVKQIRRYNIVADHLIDTIALWDLFAWNFQHATHAPILRIASAEPESGKTTLLATVSFLVPRPLQTVGISEAALFRSVEKWSPTVMIDEADTILIENEPLRALVNSAWTRGSSVVRCIGDDNEPHAFPTFTPIALAMNGKRLPGSTKSRSIEIWMERKLKSDTCEHFNHLDNESFGQLRQRSLRSALDLSEVLKGANPIIPQGMDNRLADNFRLQFAIADLAGGTWPERARSAAMKISGTTDASSRNTRLLAAIKDIYDARVEAEKQLPTMNDPRMVFIGSGTLIEVLTADPESEFREWSKGKAINPHQLGRVLGEFGVTSMRDPKGQSRGFYMYQFEPVWERYL
jgi:putative DNA primase/helicase